MTGVFIKICDDLWWVGSALFLNRLDFGTGRIGPETNGYSRKTLLM